MAFYKASRATARQLEYFSTALTSPPLIKQPVRTQLFRTIPKAIRQPQPLSRLFSISASLPREPKEATNFDTTRSAASSGPEAGEIPPPKQYTFAEIQDLSSAPSPNRILIDVREPGELLTTGRIPSAENMPISSAPDAVFLSPEDFEDKFGFPRPGAEDEVIFYCKAGVRSRQAALLAGQARPMFGGKIGNYEGSWVEWEKKGGPVQRE